MFTRHILIVLALCSPCSLLDRRHARSGPLFISTMFSAYNLYYYLYSLPHSSTGILCVNFLEHNATPAHNRYLSLATIIVPPPASLHICAFVDILLKCIARRKALRRRGANQTPKRRNAETPEFPFQICPQIRRPLISHLFKHTRIRLRAPTSLAACPGA